MAIEFRISSFLNKKTWIIPALFGIMCLLFITLIVCIEIRLGSVEKGTTVELPSTFAFSIGGELCAMIVGIMIALSILPAYKRQSGYVRIFVTVLAVGCVTLFGDSLQMVIDGIPELVMLNKIMCIFVFMSISAFFFFFYLYATQALRSKGKIMNTLSIIALVLLGCSLVLPFVNLFYPLYFTIDETTGVYARNNQTWWISQIIVMYIIVITIIGVFLSKETIKTKVIVLFFIGLPIGAMAAGGYKYGFSIQYTSMMISLVLIFAFIYSDKEKHLYSTNKELGMATNIQQHMLPSIFPAFPDRKEFDIYASMDPAKEVGGDFYDFFLVDDTHLALVIADVSDKGIPAALFMMASKIIIQNHAMLGRSPKDVLAAANKQICINNQENMFVTVWLGVLDLKTGILTASNAGHEKPVIKKPDGHFEIFNDKHGFVIGGVPDVTFTEYEIKLEKGSKVFIYTDGVPESSSGQNMFGIERMLDSLNKHEDLAPDGIIHGMSEDIDKFVGGKAQFDDTTMLCVEFKGYENE